MNATVSSIQLTLDNRPELIAKVNDLIGTRPFAMAERSKDGYSLLTDLRLIGLFSGYHYFNDNTIRMRLHHTQGEVEFECRLNDHLRRVTAFTFENDTVLITWFDEGPRWLMLRPQQGE